MSWENEKNVLTNWLKCLEKLIKMSWQNFKGYKTNFFRGKNSRLKNNYTVEFIFNIRHTGKNGRYPPNGNCFKFGGLNPYSGGTWFLRWKSLTTSAIFWFVLILILVELDFWALEKDGVVEIIPVLILILVELDFWGHKKIACERVHKVLILILVELDFWES